MLSEVYEDHMRHLRSRIFKIKEGPYFDREQWLYCSFKSFLVNVTLYISTKIAVKSRPL